MNNWHSLVGRQVSLSQVSLFHMQGPTWLMRVCGLAGVDSEGRFRFHPPATKWSDLLPRGCPCCGGALTFLDSEIGCEASCVGCGFEVDLCGGYDHVGLGLPEWAPLLSVPSVRALSKGVVRVWFAERMG